MTNIRSTFIAFLLCVFAAGAYAEQPVNENWLANQGFEEADDNGLPTGWHVNEKADWADVSLDTETYRSGKQSLHVHYDTSKAKYKASAYGFTIYRGAPARFVPGETYTVSGYVKTSGLSDRGSTGFRILQYPAPFPPGAIIKSPSLRGSHDWQRLVITFTAREGIRNIMVSLNARVFDGDDAHIWFDDFKVEKGPVATDYVDTFDAEYYGFSGRPPDHFPVNLDYRASTDIQTPHAAPALGATPRPLTSIFIAHPNYMRWPAEIAQRSDIAVDSAPVNGRKTGYKQAIVYECAAIMHERLEADPQVIIMYPDTFELLTNGDRRGIIDRVRRGRGLVLFDLTSANRDIVKKLIPDAEPIDRKYGSYLRGYTLGEGRIVTAERLPFDNTNTFLREQLADQMVRAAYIAGEFDPAEVETELSSRLIDAGEPWSVTCTSSIAPASWRVRLRPVRKTTSFSTWSETIELLHEQTLSGGATVTAQMPPLASGSYMVEATALDADGRAIGWDMRALPCDGPVEITSIDTDRSTLGKDGELNATAVIFCREGAPNRLTFTAEARDTNGRLLAAAPPRDVPLFTGRNEVPIALTVPDTTSPQVRLTVSLQRGDARVAERFARFSGEAMLREPDYRFAYYHDHAAGLKSLGADTVVARTPEATDMGFRLYPWLDVIPYGRTTAVLRESDVITSEQTQQRLAGAVREYLNDMEPFSPVAAIAIDEWAFDEMREQDVDAHLAYFRDYLRKTYGSIADLNKAWATQLASFDDVTFELCDLELVRHEGAPLVRWGDMHAMREAAVADYFNHLADAGLAVDPNFKLGLSGTRDTTGINGLDWWALMQRPCSIAAYSGLQLRLHESFAKPGDLLYRWSYVTRDNTPRGKFDPWRWLFKGHDGYLHYGGNHSNLFRPCFSPHTSARTVQQSIADIRSGPARMIRGAQRDNGAIGLLYSPASYRYEKGRRHTSRGGVGASSNDIGLSFDRALADNGFDSRWISYEQLAGGALSSDAVKVFILPAASAMSDAEVEAVRQFVRAGGTVIADVRPAVVDERLRSRPSAALDDVFGFEPQTSAEKLEDVTVQLPYGVELAAQAGEWDIKLAPAARPQARLADKETTAPAVIVHPFGRGKAVLLNFVVSDYFKQRGGGVGGEVSEESSEASAAPLRTLLAGALAAEADLYAPVRITDPEGQPLTNSRIYSWRDGDVRYIGFIQHYGDDEDPLLTTDAKLHLAESGRLYDVRTHTDLGTRETHDIKVTEAEAKFYALMPDAVGDIDLAVTPRVKQGEFVELEARIAGAKQRHVFIATIADPTGVVKPWHRFTVDAPGGGVRDRVHVALDAMPGEWTVTFTEAVSGHSTKRVFTVQER